MGPGGTWGISVPSSQFIFKPKNAVKNKEMILQGPESQGWEGE